MIYILIYLITVVLSYFMLRFAHKHNIIVLGIEHIIMMLIPLVNLVLLIVSFFEILYELFFSNQIKYEKFIHKFFKVNKNKYQ